MDLNFLLAFSDFKDLDDIALLEISRNTNIEAYPADERILAESVKDTVVYVMQGTLEVQSQGGVCLVFQSGSERAQNPVFSSSTPGLYARCKTPCRLLQVNRETMEKFGIHHNRETDDLNIEEFATLVSGDSSLALVNQILQTFKSHSISLPSLTEIALYIRASIDKDSIDTRKLAKIVQVDPVLAARLVQVANGERYSHRPRCSSIPEAIERIGLEGLTTIVKAVVLRDQFKPASPLVRQYMIRFYEHSLRTGLLCYRLAKRLSRYKPEFVPEHAFLSGVLHDIGVVPVLVVVDQHTDISHKAANLDRTLAELKGHIGSIMLQQWGFDDEYSENAAHATDWKREVEQPDYCDLIQVALMHSHLVGGEKFDGPALPELPAFHRLGMEKLDPAKTLKSLQEVGQRVSDMIAIVCA